METKRMHFLIAGALVLATALAGAAARDTANAPRQPSGRTSFAAASSGPVSFTGQLDRTAVLSGGDGLVRMELVLAAAETGAPASMRRPTDLVIILDRSGSMAGEKIEHARAAVHALIGQLGPQDQFALVSYSDDAAVTIPLSAVRDSARSAWASTVQTIAADGGTNISRGLDVALALVAEKRAAGRVPHVILISDGLANLGDPSPEGLRRRAQLAARGEYMLSAVGVGADFNEQLMSSLADAGTGNYYYLKDSSELASVFARELDAARTTVASALAVRIEPAPGVRVIDAAGYPLENLDGGLVFRPGSLFSGQERRLWVSLAVPQHSAGEYDVGQFSLSYGGGQTRTTLRFSETPRVACVGTQDEFYRGVDTGAWSRSVVVDAYNDMQKDVADAVKAGRRDEALQRLRVFKDETAAMNAQIRSAPVAEQLESADRLEEDVSAAFEGPAQAERQNDLSKESGARALDARRAGSKK